MQWLPTTLRQLSACLWAWFSLILIPWAGAVVPDPDRESTARTGWHWWLNQSIDQLEAKRASGERIIDLEWSPTQPGTFDAILVQNSGVYQRPNSWWVGFNKDDVFAKLAYSEVRMTTLLPYTVNNERRFAFTLIKNEGDAYKEWFWNFDRTPAEVSADVNAHGLRLIDHSVYVVNGQMLYAFVGIKNQGVDAKAWWWFTGVSGEFVVGQVKQLGARLLDIEVLPNGRFSVLMVKNDGTPWWYGLGATYQQMSETLALTGARLVNLKSYLVNGSRRYAFISIDNVNDETRRLRSIFGQAFSDPAFGDEVHRGFFVKQVNGSTLADLGGSYRFLPMSTIKLLPYLRAMTEIDEGTATLDGTFLSWVEGTVDDPTTQPDETKDVWCLQSGAPNTRIGTASMRDCLRTMMWESHNRTTVAFFDRYEMAEAEDAGQEGPMTTFAHSLGMNDTEMHHSCATSAWLKNRSTLRDLGKLCEGVENLQFVSKASTREAFWGHLRTADYDGESYTSPITGRSGSARNNSVRDIVKREAGPAKQGIVEEFLGHVVWHNKGGSAAVGEGSGYRYGYTDFRLLRVPFKVNGQIVLKSFVAGWFLNDILNPPGCPIEHPTDDTCKELWEPQWEALADFKIELLAEPIRLALATWPAPAPVIQSIKRSSGAWHISWAAVPGATYRLQYATKLLDKNTVWYDVGGDVIATSTTASKSDSPPPGTRGRFYQVVLVL